MVFRLKKNASWPVDTNRPYFLDKYNTIKNNLLSINDLFTLHIIAYKIVFLIWKPLVLNRGPGM